MVSDEEDDDDGEQKLSVDGALAELQSEIDHFQKEVDICEQERLGSIQIAVGNLGMVCGLSWSKTVVSPWRFSVSVSSCLTELASNRHAGNDGRFSQKLGESICQNHQRSSPSVVPSLGGRLV